MRAADCFPARVLVPVLPDDAGVQESEFASEAFGYSATRHQREVGTGYFDIAVVSGGLTATAGLRGSTEEAQF